MKPYILTLLTVIMLSSCGSAYHARRSAFHQRMYLAKGGKVDSTSTKVLDSAKVSGTELSGNSAKLPDVDSVKQYCRELLSGELVIPINLEPVRKEKQEPWKVITKIQREVCPQEAIDSTYSVTLEIQGVKYQIPVSVKIKASGGRLEWSVKSGEVSAPFVKKEVRPVIYTPTPFKDKAMYSFFGSLIGAFTLLLILYINRKRK